MVTLNGSELVTVTSVLNTGGPAAISEITTTGAIAALVSGSIVPSNLSPTSDNTAIFTAALATAAITGQPIFIPAGRWPGNIVINQSNVTVLGAGKPLYNSTSNTLVGGTVIVGNILASTGATAYNAITIGNIGVDQTTLADTVTEGINVSTTTNFYIYNASALGRGFSVHGSAHGFLTQNGGPGVFDNTYVNGYQHGWAVRSSNIIGSDNFSDNTEADSVVFKADIAARTGFNIAQNIVWTNFIANATNSGTTGRVYFDQAGDNTSPMGNITVSNGVINGGNAPSIQSDIAATGTLNHIALVNLVTQTTFNNADIQLTAGDDFSLTNVKSVSSTAFAFRNTGATNVYCAACSYENSGSGLNGTFIGQMNNQDLNIIYPTTFFQTGIALTTGLAKVGNNTASNFGGSLEILNYSGSSGLWYAQAWLGNSTGVQFKLDPSAHALGSQTYTVTAFDISSAGDIGIKNFNALATGRAVNTTASVATITIAAGIATTYIATPASTITVTLAAPQRDGERRRIFFGAGTTVTWAVTSPATAVVAQLPTVFAAGTSIEVFYNSVAGTPTNSAATTWYAY